MCRLFSLCVIRLELGRVFMCSVRLVLLVIRLSFLLFRCMFSWIFGYCVWNCLSSGVIYVMLIE